jgi:hypothetical protein
VSLARRRRPREAQFINTPLRETVGVASLAAGIAFQ